MTPWYRRVEVEGAVDVYDALNFNRPADGRNFFAGIGTTAPRANEIGLGLLSLGAHVEPEPVGLHLVLQAGPQADLLNAAEPEGDGIGRDVWRHVQRASIELDLDVGRGLDIEIGIMPSPMGFEGLRSNENWNYTRSYMAELSPYYFTGFRAEYHVTKTYSVSALLVNGWQLKSDDNASKTVGLQAKLEGRAGTLALSALAGRERPRDNENWRLWADVVAQVPLTTWLTIAATGDVAVEQRPRLQAARWAGAAGYVRTVLAPGMAIVLRGEVFTDPDGAITGIAQDLVEGTATLEVRPLPSLSLKLEARHDVSTQPVFATAARRADDEIGRARAQTLVVLAAVASF